MLVANIGAYSWGIWAENKMLAKACDSQSERHWQMLKQLANLANDPVTTRSESLNNVSRANVD